MNINQDEIEELWGKITPKLYGYLINTLRDANLADDVLQTTWLKALEALPVFKERGHGFSAWIFSIARNEMRMHWRKSGREVAYDPELHDIVKEDKNYEDVKIVEQAMNLLPREDQELLRLRFIADLSMGEIGRVLKINPISVRVKMHRTLNKVRLILKQRYE